MGSVVRLAGIAMTLGFCLASLAGFTAGAVAGVAADSRPTAAVCPVCHVEEGTIAAEPVRATRRYEGREYHFCSDRCADRFEKEPARYLAAAEAPSPDGAAPDSAAGEANPDSAVFGWSLSPRVSTAPT